MNIAVIGSGSIGSTLGKKWARAGHRVVFGTRNPESAKLHALLAEVGPGASAATIGEAVASADVVLLAIPGQAVEETARTVARLLKGKTIIDATNRVGAMAMNSVELLTSIAPDSSVYRAFNSLGWENFEQPLFSGLKADLFFCGPDTAGRAKVERLVTDTGLRPVYLGGPEKTPLVDAVTGLWFALALGRKMGRHLAFKVLSDQDL